MTNLPTVVVITGYQDISRIIDIFNDVWGSEGPDWE